jgi:hypothetical protein
VLTSELTFHDRVTADLISTISLAPCVGGVASTRPPYCWVVQELIRPAGHIHHASALDQRPNSGGEGFQSGPVEWLTPEVEISTQGSGKGGGGHS